MSRAFYLFSIVAVPAAFMVASWVASVGALGVGPTPVRAWSMIASFYAFGVFILFWYRAWRPLGGGTQKFNPARMALLLLVPLFNLYWFFRAVWGWPKAYNYVTREKELNVPPVNDKFFLAYCIFTVAAVAVNPGHILKVDFYGREVALLFMSQATKAAQLLFDAVIIWLVCGAVNRLPEEARRPGGPSSASDINLK
jgi:hypothetical protein